MLITVPENNTVCEAGQTVFVVFNESMDTSHIPDIQMIEGWYSNVMKFSFVGWKSTINKNDTAVWTHTPAWEKNAEKKKLQISKYFDLSGNEGKNFTISFHVESKNAPRVISTVPSNYSENVSVTGDVSVVFNETMNSSTAPSIEILAGPDTGQLNFAGWTTTNNTNDTAVWNCSGWPQSKVILLGIYNYTDTSGNEGASHYIYFKTKDSMPPSIKEVRPIEGDSFVQIGSPVYVVFNESMNTSTVPEISQTVGKDPGNWTFLGWQSTYNKDDTAVWSHNSWDDFENVTLTVSNYSDIAGNIGSIYSWSFRTGDHRVPQVIETYPECFNTSAELNGTVKVVFNSGMNEEVIPQLEIPNATVRFIGWNTTYTDGDTAIWHYENLSSSENITVRVSNYSDLCEILPTDGILVYLYDNFCFNISGTVNPYPSKQLYTGWNSIGYPFLDGVPAKSVLSSISGDYDMVKTYNSTGGEKYLNDTDQMLPGDSYWVHVTSDCVWSLSAHSLSELENLFPRFGWIYENGSTGNIQNSIIAGCGYKSEDLSGISVQSDLVKISSSDIRNGYCGVYIKDSSPIISQNTIHNSHFGIISEEASPILSHNSVFSNSEGGITIRRGFPIIASNEIYSNNGIGIEIYNSTAILDSDTISSNTGDAVKAVNSSISAYSLVVKNNPTGLYASSSNITLKGGTFSNNGYGMAVLNTTINVSSNDFSEEQYDIVLDNSSGVIYDNTMSSSERAHIMCKNESSPDIYGNILISGDSGIYVSDSSPSIRDNIIGRNSGSGIQVQNSKGFHISSNKITDNGWAGVYLDHSAPVIENNSISSNDFGIAAFASDTLIKNNTISSNRWYGLSTVYSSITVDNTNFIKNKWYGLLSSYSRCDMKNVTISNSTYQLYLTHDSRTYSINSSIDQEKVHLDYTSILYVKYFLDMRTEDSMGNLLNGVKYTIRDRTGSTLISGRTIYGKALYIPLTSYVRTSVGITDMHNPYNLSISWNGTSHTREFYLNSTTYENFSFAAKGYSIKEDSRPTPLFNVTEWLPMESNSTFSVNHSVGITSYFIGDLFYVKPDKNWNGVENITIKEMVGNTTVGEYRFLLDVVAVDDAPELIGENPAYSQGKYTVFRITYSDVENEMPQYIRVVIDEKTYDMYPADINDRNVVDGKVYIYRARLSPGEHTFHFVCSDGTNVVSSEDQKIDVQPSSDILMYAIAAFLAAGILIVLFVSYRIRKLKKGSAEIEETEESEKAQPSSQRAVGSSLDKRRLWRNKRGNEPDMSPIKENSLVRHESKIDRIESKPEQSVTASEGPHEIIKEEISQKSAPVEAAAAESEPKKEFKYGRSKYLEMQKKHRKLRVLVEERDKYKIQAEAKEQQIPPQEDIDEILKTIKGEN